MPGDGRAGSEVLPAGPPRKSLRENKASPAATRVVSRDFSTARTALREGPTGREFASAGGGGQQTDEGEERDCCIFLHTSKQAKRPRATNRYSIYCQPLPVSRSETAAGYRLTYILSTRESEGPSDAMVLLALATRPRRKPNVLCACATLAHAYAESKPTGYTHLLPFYSALVRYASSEPVGGKIRRGEERPAPHNSWHIAVLFVVTTGATAG
ncbi:hypothetical protein GGS23DRAFT_80157 [Durotheca rogersii]|uniref:uncharacterized protein n=1 Tax=Durotheca rogersii TaxID=419775 RepID=UPI00221FF6C8|nr:uncharacterized protein GGS23DRAFT_80157 [Durotheca rogersii]KAI5862523.1 hypothetical protein GGS23DRAFT_80157 [Durotheca rogersii]